MISFSSIPNFLRESTKSLDFWFTDFWTLKRFVPDSSIPRLTLAISGTTATLPVPSTTRGAPLSWEMTDIGSFKPRAENTKRKINIEAIKVRGCLRSFSVSIEENYSRFRIPLFLITLLLGFLPPMPFPIRPPRPRSHSLKQSASGLLPGWHDPAGEYF